MMTEVAYPPNDQEDQILLMLDNSRVTLERLMNICREGAQEKTNDKVLMVRMRVYVRHVAADDLRRAGDVQQGICLKEALRHLYECLDGKPSESYWLGLVNYYKQKFAELGE
jgi:hypothetical protein